MRGWWNWSPSRAACSSCWACSRAPVGLVLAILYGFYWFVGPLHSALTLDHYVFAARGSSDAAILNCFFFLSSVCGGEWRLESGPASRSGGPGGCGFPMGALRAGGSAHRGRLSFRPARAREVVRDYRQARQHQPQHAAWRRRFPGTDRRPVAHAGPARAAHGIHPVRHDGRGLLHVMGAERLLGQLCDTEHGSLHSELLPVPVSLRGRSRCLES